MQCIKQNLVVLTATLSFCALLVQQFYKLVKCNGSRICNGGVKPVETNSNLRQSENNEQNLQPTPDISFVLATSTPFWSCTHPLIHWNSTLKFWVTTPLLESHFSSDTFHRQQWGHFVLPVGDLDLNGWRLVDIGHLDIWALAKTGHSLVDRSGSTSRLGPHPHLISWSVPYRDSKMGGLDLAETALKH